MSKARRIKRKLQREEQLHLSVLATICGQFYEFLSSSPQPTDKEVRDSFSASNAKWKNYCQIHKLMNIDHLFELNVHEAWKRHSKQLQTNN